MDNQQTQVRPYDSIKSFMTSKSVSDKFEELLGKKTPGFITSVLALCNQNKMLANCEPAKIYQAAAMAAMLDLPLNPNLGFAYIIPYNEKTGETDPNTGKDIYKPVPQFQVGYKGFIQLAQRSGQFQNINVTDVREGELKKHDRLTGEIEFDWNNTDRSSKKVIGYAGFFSLINGFSKTVFMSVDELNTHGKKYSKTYNQSSSKWKTEFDAMATKTLIKLMLSKYAPLSIDMQTATMADQAVIKSIEGGLENAEFEYVDNDDIQVVSEAVVAIESLEELYHDTVSKLTDAEKADAVRIIQNKEQTSYAKLHKLLASK